MSIAFTPDFYLPANGMYIALIAPDRSAAKAKTLHVQHPEIRIEIFHGTHGRREVETPSPRRYGGSSGAVFL